MRLPANQLIANKGSTHAQSRPRVLLKKARVFRNFSLQIPSKRNLEIVHCYSYNVLHQKAYIMHVQSKMFVVSQLFEIFFWQCLGSALISVRIRIQEFDDQKQ
jgi:hypothetical protein